MPWINTTGGSSGLLTQSAFAPVGLAYGLCNARRAAPGRVLLEAIGAPIPVHAATSASFVCAEAETGLRKAVQASSTTPAMLFARGWNTITLL
ncbi:hypothetical protein GCM10007338_03820 [Corynebacterium pelargi]|nr:hypothetical protein GCM10007338_03820 [Corynebacterium pelargi]